MAAKKLLERHFNFLEAIFATGFEGEPQQFLNNGT